ncbi:hypothetical protein [Spiroplasma ixodetis]|nr:hypothetical protein [Spiroplasma ixodetis]
MGEPRSGEGRSPYILEINYRTSPHMYLWRKQWNWMSSTMLFKQNRIV